MGQNLRDMLAQTWQLTVDGTTRLLPKLLVGGLIVLVGLLLARLVRAVIAKFVVAVRLDRISDRLGVSAFLARGDAQYTVAEALATIVYWLVLILTLQVLGLALGFEGLAHFFTQILAYLPRLVVALAIVVVGLGIGSFFGSAVQVAAANAGLPGSRAFGRTVKYLIGFFALAIAFEQLQIVSRLLVTTVQTLIGGLTLALALAFGIGCRDLAREAAEKWLRRGPGPSRPGASE
jgi:uncharacterized membrane protein YhdT